MHQGRHQAQRVDFPVLCPVLFASVPHQVNKFLLVVDTFQVQRNADPVGGRASPVTVEDRFRCRSSAIGFDHLFDRTKD